MEGYRFGKWENKPKLVTELDQIADLLFLEQDVYILTRSSQLHIYLEFAEKLIILGNDYTREDLHSSEGFSNIYYGPAKTIIAKANSLRYFWVTDGQLIEIPELYLIDFQISGNYAYSTKDLYYYQEQKAGFNYLSEAPKKIVTNGSDYAALERNGQINSNLERINGMAKVTDLVMSSSITLLLTKQNQVYEYDHLTEKLELIELPKDKIILELGLDRDLAYVLTKDGYVLIWGGLESPTDWHNYYKLVNLVDLELNQLAIINFRLFMGGCWILTNQKKLTQPLKDLDNLELVDDPNYFKVSQRDNDQTQSQTMIVLFNQIKKRQEYYLVPYYQLLDDSDPNSYLSITGIPISTF